MNKVINFKRKFVVIKDDDIAKYLTTTEKQILDAILNKIQIMRFNNGKAPNNYYLVINANEPYADKVATIMKQYGHYETEGPFLFSLKEYDPPRRVGDYRG